MDDFEIPTTLKINLLNYYLIFQFMSFFVFRV